MLIFYHLNWILTDFAYATLAACTARAHVRKKQIRRLLDIANTAKDHNIGKQAAPPFSATPIRHAHRSPLCPRPLPPVLLFTAFRYSCHDHFGSKVHRDGPSAPQPAALAAPAQCQPGAPTAARRRIWQPLQHRAGDAGGWSLDGCCWADATPPVAVVGLGRSHRAEELLEPDGGARLLGSAPGSRWRFH